LDYAVGVEMIRLMTAVAVASLMSSCSLRLQDKSGSRQPKPDGPTGHPNTQPIADANPVIPEYRFNLITKRCEKNGVVGYNADQLIECGSLSNKVLTGQDLSKKNLRGIQLMNVNLDSANLEGSDLQGAQLRDSNLKNTNLQRANLEHSFLNNSNFSGARIHGANFLTFKSDGAGVHADMEGAIWDGAVFDHRTQLPYSLNDAIKQHRMRFDTSELSQFSPSPDQLVVGTQSVRLEFSRTGDFPISSEESALVMLDLLSMVRYQFDQVNPTSWAAKFFGGTSMRDTLRFFSDRIRYVGGSTEVKSQNQTKSITVATNVTPTILKLAQGLNFVQQSSAQTALLLAKPAISINGREVLFPNPAPGMMKIDAGYVRLSRGPIPRLMTLLHEAHHSSCAQLPNTADLRLQAQGKFDQLSDRRCENLHAKCPTGHELAGSYACDSHAWGSYAVSAAISGAFARHCKNCRESERQIALIAEKDYLSRIIPLESMLSGADSGPNLNQITIDAIDQILPGYKAAHGGGL
jgi:hypothetical protein